MLLWVKGIVTVKGGGEEAEKQQQHKIRRTSRGRRDRPPFKIRCSVVNRVFKAVSSTSSLAISTSSLYFYIEIV